MTSEQSAAALQHAELFKKLIESGPAIAFIWDPGENWPVLYVSENISALGYRAEDFLAGKFAYNDIIHRDDRERVAAEVKASIASDRTKFEQRYRVLSAEGEVRLVRDWTTLIRGADGKLRYIEGVIIDITDFAEADEKARRYLNISNNIFLSVDGKGNVKEVNDRTCQLVGESREKLLGSNWLDNYVAEDMRAVTTNALETIIADKVPGIQEFENEIVSKTGKRHCIHWYYSFVLDTDGKVNGVEAFGADVSKYRKAEKFTDGLTHSLMENPNPVFRLSNEGDVLFANNAAQELISKIAGSDASSQQSWDRLVQAAVAASDDDSQELQIEDTAYLFMINPDRTSKYYNLYGIDISDQKALTSQLEGISTSLPGALFEYTIFPDGKDEISYMSPGCEEIWELSADEIKGNPRPMWEMILPEDFDAMRQSVLQSGEQLTQWNHVWRIKPQSGEVKWLRGSGTPKRRSDGGTSWTSVIIDITEAKEAEEAATEALHKIIYVLSAALETRDPYTAGHEARVTQIAVTIAKEMGLEANRLKGLELASTVHDIGKIRIPAEILSKPGRLTEAEFNLMKTHPVVGADLLQDIKFEWPISSIVRQHHERFDGSGYPDGLKGDGILLEARILAVADTMEAMAADRPYRPGLGIEKAAEEIRQGAGSRYDPDVAATCLKLVAENKITLNR